ncbi:MAG: DUF1080 domain-containing protein [Bacteroidales bacterium]|nr:DUF1080 domain-containing protein [Bacteroidales bacterium]
MKKKSILTLAVITMIIAAAVSCKSNTRKSETSDDSEPVTVNLFNGNNLENWDFFLRDQSVDPSGVFLVKDGVIHITGQPFGYMRTKESYSDYVLSLEWRWPVEATNSGVFINAQTPDTIWPKCVEVQLKAGNAGDFVTMNGADMAERTDKSVRVIKKMAETSEKEPGEWNKMEVTCTGNTITVYINSILQNKGTEVDPAGGHICMQSEGKAIEFRNIILTQKK